MNLEVDEIQRFIMSNDIKEGKFKVKNSLVYKAYKKWSMKPKTNYEFMHAFNEYFTPYVETVHYRYYMLNVRAVELMNRIDNQKIKIR